MSKKKKCISEGSLLDLAQSDLGGCCPDGTGGKAATCPGRRPRDQGVIPGSGRSPGGGHGSPLQYSSLENSLDRGAWRATLHRIAKSQTWLKGLSMHACTVLRGKWAAFCLMLFKLFMMCYIDLKGPPVTSMAPHSSTVAWKIPWMEDPGRLQSMGSLWVGHDWATSLSLSLIWNDHL